MRRGKVVPLTPEVWAVFNECAIRCGQRKLAAERIGIDKSTLTRILLHRRPMIMDTTVEAAQCVLHELRTGHVMKPKRGEGQLVRKTWHCRQCDRDLPIKRFNRRRNKRGEMTHRYTCKDCESRGRFQHGGRSGYVPLDRKMWEIFDEITRRCASQAEAARRLGFTESRPLNQILWRRNQYVQHRTAERAILLLKELRDGNVWLEKTRGAKRAEYADEIRCRGCGTDLDNYTADCHSCWERKNGRERRADPERAAAMKAHDRASKARQRQRKKVDSTRT